MKPSTIKRKVNRLLLELTELADIVNKHLSSKDKESMIESLKSYEHFREVLIGIPFDTLTATGKKPRTRNGIDRQVFERYCYTCAVCNVRDLTMESLSCVRLCKDPKKPDDRICLCKEHHKALNKLVPWMERDSVGEKALDALKKIQKEYVEKEGLMLVEE